MSTPPVPFVDFRAHTTPLRAEIDAALARVLDSGWLILGPEVEAFEGELAAACGMKASVGVANGTDALELALRALGVGAGDEVVTTPLTAAFTSLAVMRLGAHPVFADLDPDTLNISPAAAQKAITPKTKAILPVHLYGHPADLEPLLQIARDHRLALLEDACQSVGAAYKGRPVGSWSGVAALSFYPTKNLGAVGDGGAVLVDDEGLRDRIRRLRNGGQRDRYRHEEAGVNSRLDELQAAVLRVKLSRLSAWTERRRALAALYGRELAGLPLRLPVEQPYARAVHHLYVVRHPRRDALAAFLKERGVATLIHYPIPLHLQPAFAACGAREGQLPVAEAAAREILSLPLYPEMTDEQALRVASSVRDFFAASR